MDMLKKIFPYSFGAADVKTLVIKIVVYVVAGWVIGFVLGLLSVVPVVGIIAQVLGTVVGLYSAAGWILAVLDYLKVLK